jgi:choline kinase
LEALRKAGVDEVSIVTGYKADLLRGRGLVEFYNQRWAETNMVSSLECAQDWLQAEPCIVSYSDIFFMAYAVKSLIDSNFDLAVTYDPNWFALWKKRFVDPLLDAETFRLNLDGTLAEIGKEPKSLDQVQGQYMGLLRFTPDGWAEVVRIRAGLSPSECDRMHMTGTLQKVIEEGRTAIQALPYQLAWGEIDSAEDLTVYQDSGPYGDWV